MCRRNAAFESRHFVGNRDKVRTCLRSVANNVCRNGIKE